MLWCSSKWFLLPLPCRKAEEVFLQRLLWEPAQVLECKTLKSLGLPPKTWSPVVFTSKVCPHWALIHWVHCRFSYPVTGSHGSFCSRISAQVSCNSLYLPFCLPIIRSSALFCVLPLLWIQESCLFFSPFSFLLLLPFSHALWPVERLNWGRLQQKHRVLTAGPLGKPHLAFNLLALSGDCKALIFRTENGVCGFLAPAGGIYESPGYLGPSQDILGVISFSIQAQEKHLPAGESSCSENKMGSCLR